MKAQLWDTLNFITKLRPRRLWNAALVTASYYRSKWSGRPGQGGLPMTISFEPTTACNLRCPECPSGLRAFTRPTGNLREDFFRHTIDNLSKHLLCLIFNFKA